MVAGSSGYRFIRLLEGTDFPIGADVPHVIIGDIIAIPEAIDYALTTRKNLKHPKTAYNSLNIKTPQT